MVPDETTPAAHWPALYAVSFGFFMVLLDSTIVSVATPALMRHFATDVGSVLWVTSSYLLAYAVPLLVTGRLGDRIGPKNVYLAGLVVFTLSSLWCGLSSGVTSLILARVVQGLGASMMTPQTMTIITRLFPGRMRGRAMALWGATAGAATLIGPVLGGILIDSLGWEWIFFVNIPIGVVAFLLAARLVPRLETHAHSFDWVGVALSASGIFCVVFAIQEGGTYGWGRITGFLSIPLLLVTGMVLLSVFVWTQSRVRREPLVPLRLFTDRNFSLANLAVTTVGFTVTAMAFPFTIYAQSVRGLSPTQAALLLAPQAVVTIILARPSGALIDRLHPRVLAGSGLLLLSVCIVALSMSMRPNTPYPQILVVAVFLGVANSAVWGPLSTSATRNLPMELAGAGSGVYNTTRQVGSVLGSAAIAALMTARIQAHLPEMAAAAPHRSGKLGIPPADVAEALSAALSESMLLPAAVILIGWAAALFFQTPRHLSGKQ